MMSNVQATDRWSLRRFVQWCQDLAPAPIAARLGPAETVKIATDVGLTVSELELLNRSGATASDPMQQRLASLGLNESAIIQQDPAVFRDLQRVCSLCADKTQCRHELKHDPADSTWQNYCPNMQTFNALKAEGNAPES